MEGTHTYPCTYRPLKKTVLTSYYRTGFGQVLRQKLRQEFECGQASIARDKADLMEGTKTSLWAMQLKLKRQAGLKERIAAFTVFAKNAEKAKKLSGNLQARNVFLPWFPLTLQF